MAGVFTTSHQYPPFGGITAFPPPATVTSQNNAVYCLKQASPVFGNGFFIPYYAGIAFGYKF
jgi:hypothetical protein